MSQVLSKGFISVDARRAVAKLREHLLVDLHAYLLELVRAAVLAGAEEVSLAHDADDLYVRFAPAPCTSEEAERLLDFALAYDDDAHGRCLRLLAIGVNAALGLRPRFVDLYLRADGVPVRYRYEPDRLVEPDEAGALCERAGGATPPDGRGVDAFCLHVRRRPGWDTLKRAVTRSAPPEVDLLRLTTYASPVDVLLHGKPLERPPRGRAIARYTEEKPWRVQVELLAHDAPAHTAFLESGVRLAAHQMHPWPDVPQGLPGVAVRAVIDAPDLPTNVSRSAVRLEDASVGAATRALERCLWSCVTGLASYVASGAPRGAEIVDPEAGGHRDALGRIVGRMLQAARRDERQASRARELFAVPMLRSAAGAPLAPGDLLPMLVEYGELRSLHASEPVSDHGSPFVQRAVWVHEPWVNELLAYLPHRDITPALSDLRRGLARRRELMRAPAADPTIPRTQGEVAHTSFHVEAGDSKGLRGEMAVRDPSPHARATMHVFVEGRLLETLTIPPERLAIPAELAVEWPGHLVPTLAYDAVERNRAFHRVVSRAGKLAVSMVAQLWHRVSGDPPESLRTLARLAFANHPASAEKAGLAHAPILRTTDDRWVCATELAVLERPIRAVAAASYEGPWKTADDIPVLVLDEDDRASAQVLEATNVSVVRYERGLPLIAGHRASDTREALEASLRAELAEQGIDDPRLMWFESRLFRGYIAASPVRRALRHHLGQLVARSPRPFGVGVTAVAIDEDYMVPSDDWQSIAWPRGMPSLMAVDRHYCAIVCRDIETQLRDDAGWNPPEWLRRYLRGATADLERLPGLADGEVAEDRALLERVRSFATRWRTQKLPRIVLPPPPPPRRTPKPGAISLPLPLLGEPEPLPEAAVDPPALPPPMPPPRPPQGEPIEVRASTANPADPLEAALEAALLRFPSVRGKVVACEAGPLLAFNRETRELCVRRNHPTWAMLERSREDPDVQAAVTAAALTEINRALVSVTDAEERRALVSLLGG